jgi:hypothetical protein
MAGSVRLSKQERETILAFNEAENVAYVYTCNRGWMSHLKRLGYEPTATHADGDGRVYAKDFIIPKAMVRKPLARRKGKRATDAQLVALSKARRSPRVAARMA